MHKEKMRLFWNFLSKFCGKDRVVWEEMSWEEKRKHFKLAFGDICRTQGCFRNLNGNTNLKDIIDSIMNTFNKCQHPYKVTITQWIQIMMKRLEDK